jgi:hypothetical protein
MFLKACRLFSAQESAVIGKKESFHFPTPGSIKNFKGGARGKQRGVTPVIFISMR